jgi:hypothetical protein
VFYAIGKTSKLNRPAFFRTLPSSAVLKRYVDSSTDALVRQPRRLANLSVITHPNAAPADLILEWLDASSYLLDAQKCKAASEAFARVMTRRATMTAGNLIAITDYVHHDTLRKARVRLDVVSMLLFRKFFASLDSSKIFMYIFCDASPQWRGAELFAATMELVSVGDVQLYKRYLMPLVSISKVMLSALGKTMGLLWQIWLCTGPSIFAVSTFCLRVRAFTHDLGAERLIANMRDVLVFSQTHTHPK